MALKSQAGEGEKAHFMAGNHTDLPLDVKEGERFNSEREERLERLVLFGSIRIETNPISQFLQVDMIPRRFTKSCCSIQLLQWQPRIKSLDWSKAASSIISLHVTTCQRLSIRRKHVKRGKRKQVCF